MSTDPTQPVFEPEPDPLDPQADDNGGIDRVDTGLRMALSVLFWVILQLAETVIGALVVFQLFYTLITKETPGEGTRRLGNQLTAYIYQLHRYLTHNSGCAPFPFDDFPESIEPVGHPHQDEAA